MLMGLLRSPVLFYLYLRVVGLQAQFARLASRFTVILMRESEKVKPLRPVRDQLRFEFAQPNQGWNSAVKSASVV